MSDNLCPKKAFIVNIDHDFHYLDQRKSEIKFINIQDRLKEGMYQCAVYCGGKVENAMLSAPALLTIEVPRVNENIEYNRMSCFPNAILMNKCHWTYHQ